MTIDARSIEDPCDRRLALRAEPAGDVDVGGTQRVGTVERREQALGAQRQPAVARILDRSSVDGHAVTIPASRSDSATTINSGGCHAKTPHGCPSTTGVSEPHMPRT